MDIVDTFNHLIPSDQLDDSLIIGQNLECEASNEFGSGVRLEDSLKNMLSDKDPMFGCASAQFNLLDNEDSTFPIAGSTGMSTDRTVCKNIHMWFQIRTELKTYRISNIFYHERLYYKSY